MLIWVSFFFCLDLKISSTEPSSSTIISTDDNNNNNNVNKNTYDNNLSINEHERQQMDIVDNKIEVQLNED